MSNHTHIASNFHDDHLDVLKAHSEARRLRSEYLARGFSALARKVGGAFRNLVSGDDTQGARARQA